MSTFHTRSPITFAHRGGMADFAQNSLEAFKNAVQSGVTGIESDVWITSDGEVVLDHDGVIRRHFGLRKTLINSLSRKELPSRIPTLADLYSLCQDRFEIALDVKGVGEAHEVVENIIRQARAVNSTTTSHLYLAHDGYKDSNWRFVAKWRQFDQHIHLMDSTHPKRFDLPPLDYARRAKDAGIDIINMPGKFWKPRLIESFHDIGLGCFAFNVQRLTTMKQLATMGIDGIFSNHVRRLAKLTQDWDASNK